VLQCVAVCCSVLQCVAVCCSVLQCVAVCCSVLQCVAVCYACPSCLPTYSSYLRELFLFLCLSLFHTHSHTYQPLLRARTSAYTGEALLLVHQFLVSLTVHSTGIEESSTEVGEGVSLRVYTLESLCW